MLFIALVVTLCFLAIGAYFARRAYRHYMTIETIHLDPQCTIYLGGGGNSLGLTSEDGTTTLLVDTKMGIASRELKKEITSSTVILVNTHSHRDHVEGNALYGHSRLIAGAYTPRQWFQGARNGRYPDETIKPGEEKILSIGTEIAHVRNMGRAHTTNDVVVYLEHRKLLMTGDIVFLGNHPVLFTKSGCNVASWINVLDSVYNRYDIVTLVPGHGRITDRSGLLTIKDYFVSIGQSIGNPEKQLELKKKYKDYFAIPGMSSFEKTLRFIEKEREEKAEEVNKKL